MMAVVVDFANLAALGSRGDDADADAFPSPTPSDCLQERPLATTRPYYASRAAEPPNESR
jgi:hypothetical protein